MLRTLILIAALVAGAAAAAEPARYILDAARSEVGFRYRLQGVAMQGRIPVIDADLVLDFRNVARSRVAVRLDARRAVGGLIFATDAMRGPSVLDAARHPMIRFESTSVRGAGEAAEIRGRVTLRGVTKPVVLTARLYRQRGTDPGDLRRITVHLSGRIDRRAFGASGYPALVGPIIDLDIVARATRAR